MNIRQDKTLKNLIPFYDHLTSQVQAVCGLSIPQQGNKQLWGRVKCIRICGKVGIYVSGII